MVASKGDRQLSRFQNVFDVLCQLLASSLNLAEILQLVALGRYGSRTLEPEVTQVSDLVTKLRDPFN
jgi:hypothetical protein